MSSLEKGKSFLNCAIMLAVASLLRSDAYMGGAGGNDYLSKYGTYYSQTYHFEQTEKQRLRNIASGMLKNWIDFSGIFQNNKKFEDFLENLSYLTSSGQEVILFVRKIKNKKNNLIVYILAKKVFKSEKVNIHVYARVLDFKSGNFIDSSPLVLPGEPYFGRNDEMPLDESPKKECMPWSNCRDI